MYELRTRKRPTSRHTTVIVITFESDCREPASDDSHISVDRSLYSYIRKSSVRMEQAGFCNLGMGKVQTNDHAYYFLYPIVHSDYSKLVSTKGRFPSFRGNCTLMTWRRWQSMKSLLTGQWSLTEIIWSNSWMHACICIYIYAYADAMTRHACTYMWQEQDDRSCSAGLQTVILAVWFTQRQIRRLMIYLRTNLHSKSAYHYNGEKDW